MTLEANQLRMKKERKLKQHVEAQQQKVKPQQQQVENTKTSEQLFMEQQQSIGSSACEMPVVYLVDSDSDLEAASD